MVVTTLSYKAFSICTNHITMASIVYRTHISMHVQPTQKSSLENKVVALLTFVFMLSLNSFIYTLRNELVKQAPREAKAWNKLSRLQRRK
ncbi:hypothetical protein KIL84_010148 [Mauremys mutica]|uniref:Uncharacterized protein n=1 Tax=Mauremys mutica TaxID=74926 RepID=A0A9D3XJ22_9SAUR|nr:hypothetical protein KIL84_010148 [Mauremys mutica]